jgi:tRNA modification GTPase
VLCTVFRAPHSYTGEDVVEISSHGNPQIASQILENLLLDARMANPGEFTLRAVLNGKMDLPQAEAVNDSFLPPGLWLN